MPTYSNLPFNVVGSTIPPGADLIFDVELVEIVEGTMKFLKIDGPLCMNNQGVFNRDLLVIQYSGVSVTGHKHSTG